MQLYNTNDLISAGLGFDIRDTEVEFNESGELSGYCEITDELYEAPSTFAEDNAQVRGYFEADEAGGAIEDFALLDDGGDQVPHAHKPQCECSDDCRCIDATRAAGPARWEHIRDTHIVEEMEQAKLLRPSRSDSGHNYGVMRHAALGRERRAAELRGWCVKLRIQLRGARRRGNRIAINKLLAKADAFRKGINARYAKSVELVVSRGKAAGTESDRWEWYLLYLSKEQQASLLEDISYATR